MKRKEKENMVTRDKYWAYRGKVEQVNRPRKGTIGTKEWGMKHC